MRFARIAAVAAGVLVLGIATLLLFGALTTRSRQIEVSQVAAVKVDERAAAERLAGAVRFKTISFDDKPNASAEAFLGLHVYLAQQFPLVPRTLNLEKVGQYSLLYRWQGSDPS